MGDNQIPPASTTASTHDEPLVDRIETNLREWRRQRRAKRNIEAGNSHYNTPSDPPEPRVFRPNSLLQCRRKRYYSERNAPKEDVDPAGIFYLGSKIEEELVLPYLRAQVREWEEERYVANSLWVEEAVVAAGETVTIRGSTDAVVVDASGVPEFVFEIKSTSSLSDSPTANPHHRAQLHAYMAGLSAKHDRPVHDGAILYVSQDTLEMALVPVSFETAFWTDIGVWMAAMVDARATESLPAADPEAAWECDYCSYATRCGQATNSPVSDASPAGFVPGIEYPRDVVEDHLAAYPDIGVTATVAQQYPSLVAARDVVTPYCPECGAIPKGTDSGDRETPLCPTCAEDGKIVELRVEASSGSP